MQPVAQTWGPFGHCAFRSITAEFHLTRLQVEFIARQPLYFPPVKAGNLLRGALGSVFTPEIPTVAPSGLSDPPRPFVLRARHLNGCTFQPGEPFHFDLHVFSLNPNLNASLLRAFEILAREGLGPDRAALDLQRVVAEPISLDLSPAASPLTARPARGETLQSATPWTAGKAPAVSGSAPQKIRVDFLSPTELKYHQHLAGNPEFPILIARIRDRISTLRTTYGPGPLPIDFRGIASRAEAVRMTHCEIRHIPIERHSTRTGQVHSIGGFLGLAEYQGDLAEFLPYLEAARWTGVGRHVVWGNGEIAVTAAP